MAKGALYDATKCIGCRACQVACKQWNQLPAEKTTNRGVYQNPPSLSASTFSVVRFDEFKNGEKLQWSFTKTQCMHCQHPACAGACPVGALEKTPEGPVIYDDRKCIGCRYCMVACPFEIPTFEWGSATPWIRKCTFCADRQGGGLKPACVKTCLTGALKFGERDALISEARARIAAKPDLYVDHIYGEKEVGGTSWLYLSSIPFDKLGFPVLDVEPISVNVERVMSLIPGALVTVAAVMSGVYWLSKRRHELSAAADKKES